MCMYTERMQILLTKAQRRALEIEAKTRGVSVASVVREAIEARGAGVPADRRRAALERLMSYRIPYVPIDELNAMIDERYDDVLPS